MSKSKIYISKCDRCGNEQSSSTEHDSVFYDWGYVWFAQVNGPIHVPQKQFPKFLENTADLCPGCMKELYEWYKNIKGKNI
jgi:hypothetical protein